MTLQFVLQFDGVVAVCIVGPICRSCLDSQARPVRLLVIGQEGARSCGAKVASENGVTVLIRTAAQPIGVGLPSPPQGSLSETPETSNAADGSACTRPNGPRVARHGNYDGLAPADAAGASCGGTCESLAVLRTVLN